MNLKKIFQSCKTKQTFKIGAREVTFHRLNESSIGKEICGKDYFSYEYELATFFHNYRFPLDLFIDGGANIGFFSVLAECTFPPATRIVAVEPLRTNVTYLTELKNHNKLNFEICAKALSNEAGQQVDLFFPVDKKKSKLSDIASLNNKFKGTAGIFNEYASSSETVTTEALANIPRPGDKNILVKLDLEGNELPTLLSSEQMLQSDSIDWIIEIMINDADKNDIFALMRKNGYDAYLITNAGLVHEDRPLTLPKYYMRKQPFHTSWRNHYFTKKPREAVEEFSRRVFGFFI